MKRTVLILLLSILLMLTVSGVSAESILQVFDGTHDIPEYASFLERTVKLELARAGVTARDIRAEAGTDKDLKNLFKEAKQIDASYVLIIDHQELVNDSEGDILIGFRLYSSGDRTLVHSSQIKTHIDLDFDSAIAEGTREITERADLRRERPQAPVTPAVQPVPIPVQNSRVVISVSGAPMVILGDASEYFKFGVLGSTFVGFRPVDHWLNLSIGAHIDGSRLFTIPSVSEGTVYIANAGLGANYRLPLGRLFQINVQVSGGISIISVSRDLAASQAKAVPYSAAELGFAIRFGRASIGLGSSFTTIFEEQIPLMGIAPSLCVQFGG